MVAVVEVAAAVDTTFAAFQSPSPVPHVPLRTLTILVLLTRQYDILEKYLDYTQN